MQFVIVNNDDYVDYLQRGIVYIFSGLQARLYLTRTHAQCVIAQLGHKEHENE